jgi:hypothetical protein
MTAVRLRVVAAAAVGALALPALAYGAGEPAQRAVAVARASLQGKHDVRWAALHPKDQAVTTKAFFVGCERKNAAGLEGVTVTRVDPEGTSVYHLKLPGIGTVDVNDVTLAITFRRGSSKQAKIAEVESLWVSYKGRWVQVYSPDEYAAYKAGRCP